MTAEVPSPRIHMLIVSPQCSSSETGSRHEIPEITSGADPDQHVGAGMIPRLSEGCDQHGYQ